MANIRVRLLCEKHTWSCREHFGPLECGGIRHKEGSTLWQEQESTLGGVVSYEQSMRIMARKGCDQNSDLVIRGGCRKQGPSGIQIPTKDCLRKVNSTKHEV